MCVVKLVPSRRTDYGIRVLRYLAEWPDGRAKADDIAAAMEIPRGFLPDQVERKNLMWEGDCLVGETTPDQSGPNRPFPEAAGFRHEIPNLYLCGPSGYPGGGVHAGPGYNAYKVIAEDLGLPSPVVKERGY
jgi:phytoene dehydrogenase-like protein